jgi:uncharacterized protein with NRDE domain
VGVFNKGTSRESIVSSGRDEKANEHGTWLGVDAKGRIANMLSITQPYHLVKNDAPSRGAVDIFFLEFILINKSPKKVEL